MTRSSRLRGPTNRTVLKLLHNDFMDATDPEAQQAQPSKAKKVRAPSPTARLAEAIDRVAVAIERLIEHLEGQDRRPTAPAARSDSEQQPPLPSIKELLEARGLAVKGLAFATEEDKPLYQLAWYLGKRHSVLRDLLHKIKRAMNDGLSFSHDIGNLGSEKISTHCQFASLALEQHLLRDSQYTRSPRRTLRVLCSRDPVALNFFSGAWLERYLEETLRRCQPHIREVCRSVQVTLPTGEDFELDLVAKDKAGRLLWIEAKTGEYSGFLPKYARIRNLLGLPVDRAVLVLPEVHGDVCRNLRSQFGLWAVNIEQWEEFVQDLAVPRYPPTDGQASSSK